MNAPITLPPEIVEEFYASDCVRVICSPPAGVPSPDWIGWAHEAFPLPVVSVERLPEGGRLLLAVTLGETDEGEGEVKTPKTFRLVSSPVNHSYGKPLPIVTVNMNGAEWAPSPPKPAQPPAKIDTCSKPVRVRADTHKKIRALAKRLGLGVADTIDRAVSAMID